MTNSDVIKLQKKAESIKKLIERFSLDYIKELKPMHRSALSAVINVVGEVEHELLTGYIERGE